MAHLVIPIELEVSIDEIFNEQKIIAKTVADARIALRDLNPITSISLAKVSGSSEMNEVQEN